MRHALALEGRGGFLKPSSVGAWILWHRREQKPRHSVHKLYVSPDAAHVRTCLDAVLGLPPAIGMLSCKVGADLHNLLRSDKLVAYFASRDETMRAGNLLVRSLAGTPVHGVPFTAELGAGGLVSWGIDPPLPRAGAAVSWRSRVTLRLAESLAASHREGIRGPRAVRAAMMHVAQRGIDLW